MNFNIELHKGIGDIRFGMSLAEVKKVLLDNSPDGKSCPMDEEDSEDALGNKETVLEYVIDDDCFVNLQFHFSKTTDRLINICAVGDGVTLFGEEMLDLETEDLESFLEENGLDDVEKEQEPWGDTTFVSEKGNIDIFCDEDGISEISFGE